MPHTFSRSVASILLAICSHSALADTHQIVWQGETGAPIRSAAVAVSDQQLAVGNLAGVLTSWNQQGQQRWQIKLPGAITATPVLLDGVLIVAHSHGVSAVSSQDGQVVWQLELGDLGTQWQKSWDSEQPSAVIDQGQLLLAFANRVLRIEAQQGKIVWETRLPGSVAATPLLQDQQLWIADQDGRIVQLDAQSGKIVSESRVAQGYIQATPLALNTELVFGSRDGKIRAWDTQSGQTRWEVDHGSSWIIAPAMLHQGQILIGSSDSYLLQSIAPDSGRVNWQLETQQNVLRQALPEGENVWVATGDSYSPSSPGQLLQVSSAGKLLQRVELPAASFAQPVHWREQIWLGAEDGVLYAVGRR